MTTGIGVLEAVGKPPHDQDALQAYESQQHQFVNKILEDLERSIGDDGNRIDGFGSYAQRLLTMLRGTIREEGTRDRFVIEKVRRPIQDFTPHAAEQNYLLKMVFERVFAVIDSDVTAKYNALRLASDSDT